MARQPMVTRTILTTKASVLCLDVETQETKTVEVIVPRTYKEEAKLLSVIKSMVETDTLKAVHVSSAEVVKTLYGMPENDFITNAKELPARGAKQVEEAEE